MNFGTHPFKTREATVKISVSGFSRCTCSCILTLSETHDGLILLHCSSLHGEQNTRNQFVTIFSKTVFIWLRLGVSVSLENQFQGQFLIG
jgi:hypothetical protein